ncbi:MAG: SMI1/KNR4 family protein [Planctomycetaceae bacterium]
MEIVSMIREFVGGLARTEYGKEKVAASNAVPPETIAAVEEQLGFRLPATLSRIYTEIANGGIGPGYGIFPVHSEPETNDLVDMFRYCLEGNGSIPNWNWPGTLLPFVSHGCGIYECIDCSVPEYPVHIHNPDYLDDSGFHSSLAPLASTIEGRLVAWVINEDLIAAAKSRFGTACLS